MSISTGSGWLRRLRREERGGSIAETAIVVPIFVVAVYWSAFFYDFVQLRMKVQEAARFAAWEMTAHDLSAYEDGGNHGVSFALGATMARHRTDTLYTSLHSENELEGSHPRLMVSYEYGGSSIDNLQVGLTESVGDLVAGAIGGEIGGIVETIFGYLDDILGIAFQIGNFNRRGLISAEVTTTVRPRLIPERFLQAEDGGFYSHPVIDATEFELVGRSALIADSWTLHYGHDTSPAEGYDDNPYHNQVQRLHALLGILEYIGLADVMDALDQVADVLEGVLNIALPTRAHLASMNYERSDPPPLMTRDRLHQNTNSWQKNFHTQPFQEECTKFNCSYLDSEYNNTLQKRGAWHMGCPDPQRLPGHCWGED